ncbi:hypothetical protein HF521_014648 [Silurus meridionalis]|uniref:Aquaporin-3 n=1 Tax=Silurus meridionalis TaxID=175797 RepID=A0A8T0AAA9_SILME|nr:hypothetical protein HF521_014648 [Silurus meridionalis]
MGIQKVILDKLGRTFQIRNKLLRQGLAECLGTLILVMFGCGSVAQYVLSGGSHGIFLAVNLAFGFAATLGILVCGQVSGGHLNPAVTFALCLLGREKWRKFPVYFLFQIIGSFFGAGIIFGMYYDALQRQYEKDHKLPLGIFATYPNEHLSTANGFFDQVIGTAALIVCILAIVDPYNNPIPQGLEAFTVGFTVLVIGLSMGLILAMQHGNYWFLVPIFAPFLGTIIGVIVYQLLVGWHTEGEAREKKKESEELNVKLNDIDSAAA